MIGKRRCEFSAEFLAILIALDFGEDATHGDQLKGLLVGVDFDWGRLLDLLLRHRVLVPFCDSIKKRDLWGEVLADHRALFESKAKSVSLRQLSGVGELVRISRALREANIESLCLKGPVLSQFLYDDPIKRHFSDLDLLVRRSDICGSIEVLKQLGFRLSDLKDIESRSDTDPVWSSLYHVHLTNGQVQVELHWRISRNDRLGQMPVESLFDLKQSVSIAGEVFHTLGPLHLFEYLALHGASHCWNRLKWLLDGKLLEGRFGSAFFSTLSSRPVLLMQRLQGELGRPCFPSFQLDFISGMCLAQLLSAREYPGSFCNMLRRTFVLSVLASSTRQRFAYWSTLLVWPSVYDRVKLPRFWEFLYPLIGPVLWGIEQVRMLFGRSGKS